MTNPLIELREVYKTYGKCNHFIHALDRVSLCIRAGEFVTIVGSSGSGKSTLMNMLGCLDMPSSGSYMLDGEMVSRMSDDLLSEIRGRRVGFVFQGFNLIPSLNAVENVELPLIYRGISREHRRIMSCEALERVGLSGRLTHCPTQMSGGQQQRVAIARAIAASPPIILADEPTGNLDSTSGDDILRILRELWRDGHTVILITHDNTIATQAPRVINMRDGRILSDEEREYTDAPQKSIIFRNRTTKRMEAI